MTLPLSGAISLNDINVELGNPSSTTISISDFDTLLMIMDNPSTSVPINLSDFYGQPKAVIGFQPVTSGITTNLLDIAYGNNIWVAVGDSGVILTSNDRTTWTPRSSGTTNSLSAICYAETLGLFVAAGTGGVIRKSSDGITWNVVTSPTTNLIRDIATNGSDFVAITTTETLQAITSVDGTNWTLRPNSGNLTSFDIHWNGSLGKYVVAQEDRGIKTITTTGGTFTVATIQGYVSQSDDLYAGAWIKNDTVDLSVIMGAVDVNGYVERITSSGTLLPITSTGILNINLVAVSGIQGKEIIAAGGNDSIYRSINGTTFTSLGTFGSTSALYGGRCNNYRYVLVGFGGLIIKSTH